MKKAETYKRLLAGLIDLLIWIAALIGFSMINSPLSSWPSLITYILFGGLFFPIYMVGSSYMFRGMTLGKRIMSIQAIDKSSNEKLTFKQAMIRDWLLVVVGILYVTLQSWSVINGFDYFNAIINEDWTKIGGFISGPTLGGIMSSLVWWSPPIWFGLEVISTAANPDKESVQDRSSSSLTVKKIKNIA